MQEKKYIAWVFVISFIFIGLNLFFITKDIYYFNLLPIALFIFLTGITSLNNLFLTIVFLVPFSIPLKYFFPDSPFDFYVPTEPLLLCLMVLLLFKSIRSNIIDPKFLLHPVSLCISFYLLWMLLTSITSSIPLVSFKFFMAKLWFIAGFYIFAGIFFTSPANIKKYFWAYTISFSCVVIYTILHHSIHGVFDQQAAHIVMHPFFNDHTSYGASLAMLFPIIIGVLTIRKNKGFSINIGCILAIIFMIGIILSYSRATWLSLVISFFIWGAISLSVKMRHILLAGIAIISLFFFFQTDVLTKLKKNKVESSDDFSKHLKSITNITTDISNVERINRWKSALRMFEERPVMGWGPGTYTFTYAPYQISYDKTPISTNFGDWGNAHSEYLGALAESGLPGMVSFILILIFTIITGLRVYYKADNKEIKIIAITTITGLLTYFIHGTLNNFLDTDKASALFWGFIAILVSLDTQKNKKT